MKIIWVDGYDRESVAQRLVAKNIKYEGEANLMLAALIKSVDGESQWYRIVPDDHRLWRGMEELIGMPQHDDYGRHEVLHMASFLGTAVDGELVEHEAITAVPEWLELAIRASEALHDLYLAIGRVHLT